MANEGLADDLNSMLNMAEDILDSTRSMFTLDEIERLCFDLRRAMDYLRSPGEDSATGFTPTGFGGPLRRPLEPERDCSEPRMLLGWRRPRADTSNAVGPGPRKRDGESRI